MKPEIAAEIAMLIEDDIVGRKGIGDEWSQIDADIRTEIKEFWIELMLENSVSEGLD